MNQLTTVQIRILDLLSDGQPHLFQEIWERTDMEGAVKSVIKFHICMIRKILRPVGEDILCEIWNRTAHYRHVVLLPRRSTNMRKIRPTKFLYNEDRELVMKFFYVDEYDRPVGKEQGPSEPLESVLFAKDHRGMICNPEADEMGALLRTKSGALYGVVIDRLQIKKLNLQMNGLLDRAITRRR